MAGPQNKKRQRSDETSLADNEPPAKKTKTRSELELEAWESWVYPPEFWDRLPRIELARRALEELDRRTRPQRPPPPGSPIDQALSPTAVSRKLARFSRRGGPDLRHLRGVS